MKHNEKCYVCEETADYYCEDCERPICDDCAATSSPPNPSLERSICKECHTGIIEDCAEAAWEEEKKKRARNESRLERNRKVRERYWRPENVAKRKAKKLEREIAKAKYNRERLERSGNFFKNMKW